MVDLPIPSNLGTAVNEPARPVITGRDVAAAAAPEIRADQQMAAAIKDVANGVMDAAVPLAREQGLKDGAASVSRGPDGQLHVTPTFSFMFGRAGEAYDQAAAHGALAATSLQTDADISKLHADNLGNPEGFKKSADAYMQTLAANASGPAGAAAVQQAQHSAGQVYNGLVLRKAALDIQISATAISSRIESLSDDMADLARQGFSGSTDYIEKDQELHALYGSLQSNSLFGYPKERVDAELKDKTLRFQGEAIAGHVTAAYQKDGLLAAQRSLHDSLDAAPGMSDKDRDHFIAQGEQQLRYLQTQDSGKTAELSARVDAMDVLLKNGGKVSSSALDEAASEATRIGATATAAKAHELRSYLPFQKVTNSMSPAQFDATHGVGSGVGNGAGGATLQRLPIAPGRTVDLDHVAPELNTVLAMGQSALPPGYTVQAIEGYNPSGHVTRSAHHNAGSGAVDVQIVDPQGHIIPNKGEDTTGMYTQYAIGVINAQRQVFPTLTGRLAFGGAFGTNGTNDIADLMHFDLSGERGHIEKNLPSRLVPIGTGGKPPIMARGDATLSIVRSAAIAEGVDPAVLEGIYNGEGRGGYVGDDGSSFGPFQLHMGGLAGGVNAGPGEGDNFKRETGLDPRDPSTMPQQAAWVAKKIKQDPAFLSKFHGYKGPAGAAGSGVTSANGVSFTDQQIRDNPYLLSGFARAVAEDRATRSAGANVLGAAIERNQANGAETPMPLLMQYFQMSEGVPAMEEQRGKIQSSFTASQVVHSVLAGGGGAPEIASLAESARAIPDIFHQDLANGIQAQGKAALKQIPDDPGAAAVRMKIVDQPAAFNFADPSSIPATMAQHAAIARQLRIRSPEASASAIFPQDKDAVRQAIVYGPPDIAASVLSSINQMPQSAQDDTIEAGGIKGAVLGMARSGDPNKMGVAYTFLDQQFRQNPMLFEARFGAEARSDLSAWQNVRQFLSPEQLAKDALDARDPARENARKTLREKADTDTKALTPQQVTNEFLTTLQAWTPFGAQRFLPSGEVPAQVQGELVNEYRDAYKYQFGKSGDGDDAKKFAMDTLKLKWGASPANGGRVMMYPPENSPAYAPVGASQDWIQKQADEFVGRETAREVHAKEHGPDIMSAPYALVPDRDTETEMKSGAAPGYQVVVQDPQGRMRLLSGADGKPVRFKADRDRAKAGYRVVTDQMKRDVSPPGFPETAIPGL